MITGEGSLDEQSLAGKAPIGVARAAGTAGVPVVAVAGRSLLSTDRLAEAGIAAEPQPEVDAASEAPAKPKRSRKKKADEVAEAAPAEEAADPALAEDAPKPRRRSRAKAAAATTETASVSQDLTPAENGAEATSPDAPVEGEPEGEAGEPRRGWWQRTFGA